MKEHLRLVAPTRENGGTFAYTPEPGEEAFEQGVAQFYCGISATLALIEARRLIVAARLEWESDRDGSTARSLAPYLSRVALEIERFERSTNEGGEA